MDNCPNNGNLLDEKILDLVNSRVFYLKYLIFKPIDAPLRIKSPSLVIDAKIYAIGAGVPPFNQCFIVDPLHLTCVEIPSLKNGRLKHGLVHMNQEIYAIGGLYEDYLISVEKFNGNYWEEIAPLNYARVNPTACSHNSVIYVFSGDIENQSIEKLEHNVWKVLDFKFPLPLRKIGVARCGNNFIVAGGNLLAFRTNCNNRSAWVFDCDTEKFQSINQLPESDCFDFEGWGTSENVYMVGQKCFFSYNMLTKQWSSSKIPTVCKTCYGETCGETCKSQSKVMFYKLFKNLKPKSRLL